MKRFILLITIVTLITSSCGDEFLDRPPLAELTAGNFPETQEDAVLAVNAIYNSVRTWNINTGGFPLLDIMSDQSTKGSNPGDGATTAPFEDFTFDSTDPALQRWWATLYESIRRCNLVFERVPLIEMDAALQTRLIAEASLLRAYFYSLLVRGMGDVIVVLETTPPFGLTNTPREEILNNVILPDLETAVADLPEKSEYATEDLGRVTKGTARALLARIHLFFGNFQEVESLTAEIIASGQYDLEPNFDDVFSPEKENGIESIWEVGAVPLGFDEGGNQFGNTQGIRGAPNRGWGFGRPAYPWIAMMTNNNDPRLDPSVIFLGETLAGVVTQGDDNTPDTTYDESNNIIEIEVYNQKAWYPGTQTIESFGHNRRLIRYSDVLLMAAEALNENGKAAEALVYLNQVRARARGGNAGVLPDVTTTDQALLRQAIADERNFELAFEGLRFWDLVRTGQADEVLGPLGFTPNKHELLPIPQSEIDISEGVIKQNPEY